MTDEEKKPIFDGLISNGIRHLSRGLEGLERGELDFAVTDSFFGIEIVLKAFVFHRQWNGIARNPALVTAEQLKKGECKTKGLGESLKYLGGAGITLPHSIRHFRTLEIHRNLLVHYFHPRLRDACQRTKVATELSNAWSALRELSRSPEFSSALDAHAASFGALEGKLLVVAQYLDDQAAEIRRSHAHPEWLSECPACRRKTYEESCLICGYHEPSHRELTQGDEMVGPADCPMCGGHETVVVSGDGARCKETGCAAWFAAMHRCGYCGGFFVTENEDEVDDRDEEGPGVGSFYLGCPNCDGRVGQLANEDE